MMPPILQGCTIVLFSKKVTSKANQLVQLHWRRGEQESSCENKSLLPPKVTKKKKPFLNADICTVWRPAIFLLRKSRKSKVLKHVCKRDYLNRSAHKTLFCLSLKVNRGHFLQGVCPSFRPYSTLHNVAQQCGLSRFSRG